jgi:hypothetical protein
MKMVPTTREHDSGQVELLEGEENQWKFRAPYKIQNPDTFNSRYEGGCHCGRVQFHVKHKKPLEAKYCHCTTCQLLHGRHSGPRTIRYAHEFEARLLDGQLFSKRRT